MPKQLLEMKLFNVGTITTPDSTDIPPEAASYSLDLDSVMEDGKLKGVPDNVLVSLTSIDAAGEETNEQVSSDDISGISSIKVKDKTAMVLKTTNGWKLVSG
tara:strand:- start:512 stop:817 length:306 start_codon:yes stop_codon:yes gene_type:complete